MQPTRYSSLCVALAAFVVVTSALRTLAAEDKVVSDERELIAVLQSEAPKADKAITCKRLAVFGTANAVPALAPLLSDEELTSWARIALEAIPGAEADQALREAIGKVKGRVLIGVIHSIGVRRDAGAVAALAEQIKDAEPEVASAAAVALGNIGSDPATAALAKALSDTRPAVRSAVAEGCILCAEQLLADGKAKDAAKLYDEVRTAEIAKPRRIEATRGAILAHGSDGIPLLVEQLKSADAGMFKIGLSTARELPGREVTEALAAELGGVAPQRQALLVAALADRNDGAVLPAVLKAAQSDRENVRMAAVGALERVGDASCVPVLLDVAAADNAELAVTALAALAGLPGEEVDAALAGRLPQATGKLRGVLIELAGRRRIAAAVDALIPAADDADAEIRSLALAALGATVGQDKLAVLIAPVVAPKNPADTEAAQQALRTACVRMPDGEACAGQLVAAMSQASLPAKSAILNILGAMGNRTALDAVGAAAKSDNPELQDLASRLLGEWMTVDAAPVLLDLAKTAPEAKYQVRALRGYIRLVRQFTVPDPKRAEMCREALAAATRDPEKKLVLEVIARYPSLDMLRLAVEAGKTPSLKTDAAAAALAIAEKIGGSTDVQDLLVQIGQDPVKVEIIKAEYGAGTTFKDVTSILQKHVRDFPLIVLPSSSYNSAFGGDPAPSVVKQLKVQYRLDGRAGEATFAENATILLPAPK